MATFYNQATLSYNDTVTSSNVVSGEILESLSVRKTALDDAYADGDILAYAVSLINNGETDDTDVTVTDDLGTYAFDETTDLTPLSYVEGSARYFMDGVLQPAPTVTAADGSVAFSGLTVPAGGSAILFYEAQITAFAPRGAAQSITNTATLSGAGISDGLSASAVIPFLAAPSLSVSKSVSPAAVARSSTLTYAFLIRNCGASAADAGDNVTLRDVFSPALTDLSVTLDGTPLAADDFTYDETSGAFSTAAGVITVPAATFTQDADTGEWTTVPGAATLVISGTI